MQQFDSIEAFNAPRPCVCTIGAFDGVHLGHQQLIRHVVSQARAQGALAVVLTFFRIHARCWDVRPSAT